MSNKESTALIRPWLVSSFLSSSLTIRALSQLVSRPLDPFASGPHHPNDQDMDSSTDPSARPSSRNEHAQDPVNEGEFATLSQERDGSMPATVSMSTSEDGPSSDTRPQPDERTGNQAAAGVVDQPTRRDSSEELTRMLESLQTQVSARLDIISSNIARLEARTSIATHERLMLSERPTTATRRSAGDPVDRAYTRMRGMERLAEEDELWRSFMALERSRERLSNVVLERTTQMRAAAAAGGRQASSSMGPAHRAIEIRPDPGASPQTYSRFLSTATTDFWRRGEDQPRVASEDDEVVERSAATTQRMWENLRYRREERLRAGSSNEPDDGITSRGRRVLAREAAVNVSTQPRSTRDTSTGTP